MKVLLIDPLYTYISTRRQKHGDSSQISMGLRYISAYLKDNIPEIEIRVIQKNIEKTLNAFGPDLVGITSFSPTYPLASYYAKLCKKREIPVVIGGIHISTLPHTITEDMDFGVIGEGEETMLEIVRTLMDSNMNLDRVKSVEGVVFRGEDQQIEFSKPRELITSLDSLPFPDRNSAASRNNYHEIMVTSRGCTYKCIFCASHRMWPKMRFRSAENIVTEIEHLSREFHVRRIVFNDELFGINKKRLYEMVDLIEKRGLNKKVAFHAQLRASQTDKEMAKLLKRMNFVKIFMGLESGSQRVLDYLKSGNNSVEQYYNAVELLEEAGIRTYAFFIIGSPIETHEDILETLRFIRKSKISNFSVWILAAYPGTPLWDYANKRGLVHDNMDWRLLDVCSDYRYRLSDFERFIILSENLRREDLWKILKIFYKEKDIKNRREFFTTLPRRVRACISSPATIVPYIKNKIDIFSSRVERQIRQSFC
jgi:radical SAM superfamily enzyme YgiQ (UPF0313 family)